MQIQTWLSSYSIKLKDKKMKKYNSIFIVFALALFSLASCDKDIALPKQVTVFDGVYIYGSATPKADLDNENKMPTLNSGEYEDENKEKVNYNKYGRFIKLKAGKIIISKEENSTADAKNSIAYGKDAAGKLIKDGAVPVEHTEVGMFLVNVDLHEGTISTAKVEAWGIIGDATPGGWGTDTDMTLVADKSDDLTYVYTCDLHLFAGKQFKFRANDDWAINLGAADGVMSGGGDNIKVDKEGDYTVTLSLGRELKYSITKK